MHVVGTFQFINIIGRRQRLVIVCAWANTIVHKEESQVFIIDIVFRKINLR